MNQPLTPLTTDAPVVSGAPAGMNAVSAPTIVPHIHQVAQEFESRLSESQRQIVGTCTQGRLARAIQIAINDSVHWTDISGKFRVKSATVKGEYYYDVDLTNPKNRTCTCADRRDQPTCKHILAAYLVMKAFDLSLATETPADPPTAPTIIETPAAPQLDAIAVARHLLENEYIIYATLLYNDQVLLVEIVDYQSDSYLVRCLPVHGPEGRFEPIFPFEGRSSCQVTQDQLTNVTVYRPNLKE